MTITEGLEAQVKRGVETTPLAGLILTLIKKHLARFCHVILRR
jgi:hypothetical protein